MSAGLKDQSMNRRRYDGCKSNDDLRLTTGPGRYQLDVPTSYCDATFAPEPTVHQQKWGASMNADYTKTDVESDLFNINRPTSRTVCNQYDPKKNMINAASVTNMKEMSFPQTHTRLVDPPCTGRSTGWNRWEWLCDNPQENVFMPFDNFITSRLQQKDQFRPCIPKPVSQDSLLPAPREHDLGTSYEQFSADKLSEVSSKMNFPRGSDTIPEAPSALTGVSTNPVNPPSLAMAPYRAY
jgi:hypothetical protein